MRIGELCSYAPKSTIKAGEAVDGAKYMFFTSSADESKRYTEYQYDGEGIIMGTGGNATLHYYSGKYAVSTDCVVLVPRGNIRCKYLYYYLKANMTVLEAGFKGAGLKHTNKKYISDIDVNTVPDFCKQDEIIAILDKLNAVINSRKEELQLLEDLVSARFVEMFGDPDVNEYNWEIYKIEQLCDVGSSKRIYQNEQSRIGIPFLRVSDLVNRMDTGSKESDLYIPESRFEELKKQGLVPKSGDILLTARGTLGRCYIIQDDDEFYFQDGMITWLSKYDAKVIPLYISYLFEMPGFRKQIDSLQAGSTVAYLSIYMTKKLDIMLPPIKLQNQFADFVKEVDKSKVRQQKYTYKI